MRERALRLWTAIKRLPWQRFGAGVVAGACALVLTFILRAYGLGVFLPEIAVNFVVAHIPGDIESFFIRTMGEGAKILGVVTALAVFLALPGIAAVFYRRVQTWVPNRWGVIAIYTFGTAGVALLVVLPLLGAGFAGAGTNQGPWAAAFSQLLGGWLYAAVLDYFLVEFAAKHPTGFDVTRRNLFKWGAASVVVALLALYGVTRLLPKVARLAFASVSEMFAKEVTPTDEFYVVTKNLIDPTVDEASWRLAVGGMVVTAKTYGIDELRRMAATDEYVTFECVSNEVGGNLMSTAKWSGVPVADLINASSVVAGADWVLFTCDPDGYTVAIPLAKATDPATLLALRMNDGPLAVNHGHPARVVVPGKYGMFSAKWVTGITLVRGEVLGFWQQKGWTNAGLVRTTAIIATPPPDTIVGAAVTIGGVAFAGDRGIARVEVSTDGGLSWAPATLKTPPKSPLTWTMWTYDWSPPRGGSYRIVARAVDGTGTLQESAPAPPFSNGSAGYDAITLLVSL